MKITDAMIAKAAEVMPAMTEHAIRTLLTAALSVAPEPIQANDIEESMTAWARRDNGLWGPKTGISTGADMVRVSDAERRLLLALGAEFETNR